MSDKFISDTTTAFKLGQTVIAKVTNLDEEKRRFLVTLKISEVITPAGDARAALLNGIQERRTVKETLTFRGVLMASDTLSSCSARQNLALPVSPLIIPVSTDDGELRQQLASLTVGQKLKLMVDSATQDGAKFKSDDLPGADVIASKRHVAGTFRTIMS